MSCYLLIAYCLTGHQSVLELLQWRSVRERRLGVFESQEAAQLRFKPLIALMDVSKYLLMDQHFPFHTQGGKLHQRKGLADLEAPRRGRVCSGPEGSPYKTILS